MRQRIKNPLEIRIDGIDLNNYTNLKCFISQRGNTYEYTGTINSSNNSVMNVMVPKSDAMNFYDEPALLQVAITSSVDPNVILSHDPILIAIGTFLGEDGYGV